MNATENKIEYSTGLYAEFFWRNAYDKKERIKTFTATCLCGSPRFNLLNWAVQCQDCLKQYTWVEYEQVKIKAKRLADIEKGQVGRILPLKNEHTNLEVDGRTNEIREAKPWTPLQLAVMREKLKQTYQCDNCHRVIEWNYEHFLAGIMSAPVIMIEDKNWCYICVKERFKSE